jgi:hypothetical protein
MECMDCRLPVFGVETHAVVLRSGTELIFRQYMPIDWGSVSSYWKQPVRCRKLSEANLDCNVYKEGYVLGLN